MTREEAELKAATLNSEHPDRAKAHWRAQEMAGVWQVVRIGLPPTVPQNLTAETQADERPPTADDPRTNFDVNVGSRWALGG